MPASDDVTSDFPTPPLPDTTPITCFIFEFLLGASRNAVFLTPFLAAEADGHPSHEPRLHELADEHELLSANFFTSINYHTSSIISHII